MSYQPSPQILNKYADILVNFALHGGEGVKPKEAVFIEVPECAKPLLIALRRKVLEAGAFPIVNYHPDDMNREFFELANEDQLDFFPSSFMKGKVDQMDHIIHIIAETDKHELEGIDPRKIMRKTRAFKPYKDWRIQKEVEGKLTWTIGLYGTEAMAKEVGMTLEEYWEQIILACYLDVDDPVGKWREILGETERLKNTLDTLEIQTLHIQGQEIDLTVGLGEKRQWLGGSGRNIPSFEVFISPDWRKTEGYVLFDQPLYRYGNMIKNVRLVFKEGRVVEATAEQGQDVLQEMLKTEDADKIGEFSLTDGRMSRITRFMGETLFDENRGGEQGNMHLALGMSYKESYPGDPSTVTDEEWAELGYNDSLEHTDIVSTTERIVTATLKDGTKKVIYEQGEFKI